MSPDLGSELLSGRKHNICVSVPLCDWTYFGQSGQDFQCAQIRECSKRDISVGKGRWWREDGAIAFPTTNDQRLSILYQERPSPVMLEAAGLLSGSTHIMMGHFRPWS